MTLVINWGDGSSSFTTFAPGTTSFANITHQYLNNNLYNPNNPFNSNYTIGFTLSDQHGNTSLANTQVAIQDVGPMLSGLATTPINEGGVATLTGSVVDPGTQDTFSMVVNWNDGSAAQTFLNRASGPFTLTHQYINNLPGSASYNINLTVSDNDGASVVAALAQAVNNVAPTSISSGNQTWAVGAPITLYGSETDPGTADTFSFFWQFVTSTNGQTVPNTTTQNLSFIPTSAGNYSFLFAVHDSDGGIGGATTAVVNVQPNGGLTVSNLALSSPISEGGIVTLTGNYSNSVNDALSLVVNWADGTQTSSGPNGTSGSFSFTHKYVDNVPAFTTGLAPGVFPVSLVLSDPTAGSTVATVVTTTVSNVAPTLLGVGVTSPATISESQISTITGFVTDPGTADTFSLVVNWGDGTSQMTLPAEGAQTSVPFTATHQYLNNITLQNPTNFTINVTVTDKDGLPSGTSSIVQKVVDAAPTAIASNTLATVGVVTTLQGSQTDIGSLDTFSYLWSLVSGPAGFNMANAATQNLTFVPSLAGSYTFNFTVSDGDLSNTATVVVFATPAASSAARLGANIPLTLNGGTLGVSASAYANVSQQTFGTLTLGAGNSTIVLTGTSNNTSDLTFGNITRNPGAAVNFVSVGNELGTTAANNQLNFQTAPALSGLGSPFLPYAMINGTAGLDFVTFAGGSVNSGSVVRFNNYLVNPNLNIPIVSDFVVKLTTNTNLGISQAFNGLLLTGGLTLSGNAGTSLTLSAGSLAVSGANTISVPTVSLTTETVLTTVNTSDTLTVRSVISGSGALTLAGPGAMNFTNINTFTGGSVLDGPTLNLNSGAVLGSGTATLVSGNLVANSSVALPNAINLSNSNLNFTGSGQLVFTGAVNSSVLNPATNSTASGSTLNVNNQSVVFSGVIGAQSGPIAKTGSGTLILAGNSPAYGGFMTVNSGLLIAENLNALGTTSGILVASGAGLQLAPVIGGSFPAKALTISGTGLNGNGALENVFNANTWGDTILLAGQTTMGVDSGSLAVGTVISGAGDLNVNKVGATGAGLLTLSTINTFVGNVNLNAGILAANSVGALGRVVGAVTVASGTTLQVGAALSAKPITLSGTGFGAPSQLGGPGALVGTGAASVSFRVPLP